MTQKTLQISPERKRTLENLSPVIVVAEERRHIINKSPDLVGIALRIMAMEVPENVKKKAINWAMRSDVFGAAVKKTHTDEDLRSVTGMGITHDGSLQLDRIHNESNRSENYESADMLANTEVTNLPEENRHFAEIRENIAGIAQLSSSYELLESDAMKADDSNFTLAA